MASIRRSKKRQKSQDPDSSSESAQDLNAEDEDDVNDHFMITTVDIKEEYHNTFEEDQAGPSDLGWEYTVIKQEVDSESSNEEQFEDEQNELESDPESTGDQTSKHNGDSIRGLGATKRSEGQHSEPGVINKPQPLEEIIINIGYPNGWQSKSIVEPQSSLDGFDSTVFNWNDCMKDYKPVKEKFKPKNPGPTKKFSKPYDAFTAIWDEKIMSQIVEETNKNAEKIESSYFQKHWNPTSVDELYVLFAFWIMLGVIKMPTIKSCFSNSELLKTDVFRFLLTETRYWNLTKAFCLGNDNIEDVLSPMGAVPGLLSAKFQQLYKLKQEICVDEGLTLWKGPSGQKHIATKTAPHEIRSYQLCESATGYLWSFCLYPGGTAANSDHTQIMDLLHPVLGAGHTLFLDYSLTSPGLTRYFKQSKRTDCVAVIQNNKYVPRVIEKGYPLKEGQFIACYEGNIAVFGLQERRRLYFVSTCHGVEQVLKPGTNGRPPEYKLKVADDYSRGMAGVRKLDNMLEPYLVERKQSLDWKMKLFKRLLQLSIQNASILVEGSTGEKVKALPFRLSLVQDIIDKHHGNISKVDQRTVQSFSLKRLTERHFISRTVVTDKMKQKVRHSENRGKRQCVMCRKSKTVYECKDCDVPLCIEICFKEYHTRKPSEETPKKKRKRKSNVSDHDL